MIRSSPNTPNLTNGTLMKRPTHHSSLRLNQADSNLYPSRPTIVYNLLRLFDLKL